MTSERHDDIGISGRHAVGLWLLALAASAVVGTHGIVYWDAGDYVRLAIDGGPSGLLLGRPLFLLVSRLILAVGVEPASAEPVLRWFWSAVSATAAPLIAVLARRLGLDRAASLVAGAALALSPSFAHTSHQVLTDAPALALSIAALIAATRSQAVVSGLLLAAAIATRETAAVHAIAIALLLGRRAVVAAAVAVAVVAAIVWIFPPPGLSDWLQSMAQSAGARPPVVRTALKSMLWVLVAGPVPVAIGAVMLLRRPSGRWLVVSVPAAVATIALLFYPDGSYSPRYVLATVPLAFFFAFAAAPWLASRPRVLIAALLVPLAIVPFATGRSRAMAREGTAVMHRLGALPAGALVVPGHYCPQARLAASIEQRRDLTMMCTGWEWPADPGAALDSALDAGRPVAVDLADAAWLAGEVPARNAVRAWASRHSGEDIAGFFVVHRRR